MTDSSAIVTGLSQAAAAGAPGGWQRLKRDRLAMVALGFLRALPVDIGPFFGAD